MTAVQFYYHAASPPCLSVHLVLKALSVDVDLKKVDVIKKEHLGHEYSTVNPFSTLPAISDQGFCVYESSAIIHYLCEKFGENNNLFPKDLKKRTLVIQFLNFNSALLAKIADWIYPTLESGAEYNPKGGTALHKDLATINEYLSDKEFLVEAVSVADLAMLGTLVYLGIVQFDFSAFENILSWAEKIKKTLPYFDEVTEYFFEYVKNLDQSVFR